MKILITGNKKIIIPSLVPFLLEQDHQVTLTARGWQEADLSHKNLTIYQADETDELYEEIFRAHSFELVIFNAADEIRFIENRAAKKSQTSMEGLENVLNISQRSGIERFLLISSTSVYGSGQTGSESEAPEPDTSYGALLTNHESLCRFYSTTYHLPITVIRVPFIYGPNERYSLIFRMLSMADQNQAIWIAASESDACQFLHIQSLLTFFRRLIDSSSWKTWQVFHPASEYLNFNFIHQLVQSYFPKARIEFRAPGKRKIQRTLPPSKPAERATAQQLDQNLAHEIPALIEIIGREEKRENLITRATQKLSRLIRPFLAWIEVILGATAMHVLTILTETIIEFKSIDYRLLYVVLIGSTHGLLFGVLASFLAMASAIVRWVSIGLDWELLLYNIENWIPFALYLLAGSVTGYMHDKTTNETRFEKNQTMLIHEKYIFLYELYSEISRIKDRFREQLVGYRDSFGRFFKAANELNQLEEDSIFINALNVLEDLMKNDKISIYTIEKTTTYGRLEVKSVNFKRSIPKSLLLADYPEAITKLKTGEIFQNKELLANYPAYIAPIMNQSSLIGLIILWEADFEQFSLYYQNLFKVTSGLIQSALVRAAIFKNTQTDKLYLPSTQIMKPESFQKALALKKKMKRSRMADYVIFSLMKQNMAWEEIDVRLRKGIRDDDLVGILDSEADRCYVLFSNAGIENVELLKNRLDELGFMNLLIEDFEVS